MKYEIGAASNCECGKTIEETLDNIKAAGFDSVMMSQGKSPIEPAIKYALKIGLKIPYIHLSGSLASDIWAEGESCNEQVEVLKKGIDACEKYGIKIAVLHVTSGNAAYLALPPNSHGLKKIKEIVAYAKNAGVQIALENLDEPNFRTFEYVMEKLKDENIGFCYDCGHHNLYNPERDLFKLYGDRLVAVHLHDNLMDWKYGMDFTRDLHRLPFDGKIDFERVIKNLFAAKYNNCIMLELHRNSCGEPQLYDNTPPLEYLKEAYKRGKKLVEMFESYRKLEQ